MNKLLFQIYILKKVIIILIICILALAGYCLYVSYLLDKDSSLEKQDKSLLLDQLDELKVENERLSKALVDKLSTTPLDYIFSILFLILLIAFVIGSVISYAMYVLKNPAF